jgi:hypothetical protein
LWGKTDNNLEDDESKCSSTLGELNSIKGQDSHQENGGVNILDTVNKRSLKRPRRQPITRIRIFLWTNITKNYQGKNEYKG